MLTARGRRPATPGEIERARDLHATGHSLAQIGAELGRARETVRIWVNPTAAQRNAERAKAYSKQVKPPVRGRSCQQCTGPVRSTKARICGECRARNGQAVNTQVADLYRTGKAVREVAERVGLSEAAVVQRAHRLRAKGTHVPKAAYMPRGIHPDYHRFGFIRKTDWKPPPLPAPRPTLLSAEARRELDELIVQQKVEMARAERGWGEGRTYTRSLDEHIAEDWSLGETLTSRMDFTSHGSLERMMRTNGIAGATGIRLTTGERVADDDDY